jgi:hypothetical protein
VRVIEIWDVAEHIFPTLEQVLIALPERARRSTWTVSSYLDTDGESLFWLGGGGSDELDRMADGDRQLSGGELMELARSTSQVIWGTFEGWDAGAAEPWIRLHAMDSTFWRCETDDIAARQALMARFSDVRPGKQS